MNLNKLSLPQSLIVVRCAFTELNKPEIDLASLPNLKYLVIYHPTLSPSDIGRYVRFSIQHNLRMLSLVRGIGRPNLPTFNLENDKTAVHCYPILQKHCLIYRQKIYQIMFLEKKRLRTMPLYRKIEHIRFKSLKMQTPNKINILVFCQSNHKNHKTI